MASSFNQLIFFWVGILILHFSYINKQLSFHLTLFCQIKQIYFSLNDLGYSVNVET